MLEKIHQKVFLCDKEASFGEQKKFKNIEIPKNYDPLIGARKRLKVANNDKNQQIETLRRQNMTVRQRATLLGEKFTKGKTENSEKKEDYLTLKTQNFMSKLSDKSKNLLLGNNKFVLSSQQQSTTDTESQFMQSIFQDKNKNERYNLYIKSKQNNTQANIRYPLGFRASDINKEILEFEQIYEKRATENQKQESIKTEQEKLLDEIQEMKQKIDRVKNSRIRINWQPPKLLCQRFGVTQPKVNSEKIQKKKGPDFEKQVIPSIVEDLRKSKQNQEQINDSTDSTGIIMPDENCDDIEKAPQELFDSIFNDDDDDDF